MESIVKQAIMMTRSWGLSGITSFQKGGNVVVQIAGVCALLQQSFYLAGFLCRTVFERRTDLMKTYGAPGCWAVITGASSGIGESAAEELARQGFNVLLIARRGETMAQQCEELSGKYKVNAKYYSFDFTNAFANRQQLMDKVKSVTKGNVAVLCHMAGNSDLAVHFTDKTLERNYEVMKLQTEGTLVVVQEFCQLMCRRPERSAIMTAGAITAYAAQPGFALASANKAWIRYFSIAAAYEFSDKIDIMCAHPISVTSGIVKSSSWRMISSKQFITTSLGHLGKRVETNGSAKHDYFVWCRTDVMPNRLFNYFAYKSVPWFSKVLERPIDIRPLAEKLPVVNSKG